MAKDSGFNLVEMLNQRSKAQVKGVEKKEAEQTAVKRKPERHPVMMIDVDDLIPSAENFYQVDDSLKQSIELVGILQPLLVNRPENGKYKIIAGHRRRLAVLSLLKEGKEKHRYVPCVYKEEGVMDKLALIVANRFRDKSDWEKMREIVEAEELARELKRDHGLEGRTRDVLARIMGMSQAQIGRYKAIYNNLAQGLMESFKEGALSFSVVSELCGLPPEWQKKAERLLKVNGTLTLLDIKMLKERKEREETRDNGLDNLPPQPSDRPKAAVSTEAVPKEVTKRETKSERAEVKAERGIPAVPLEKSAGFHQVGSVGNQRKKGQETEGSQESSEEGDKQISGSETIELGNFQLSAVRYGDIRGYVVKSDQVCRRRVAVCPIVHQCKDAGEEAKYGCPVCETLGNGHSISQGIGNCPLCGVNLRWEGEGREIWEERESEIQKEAVL